MPDPRSPETTKGQPPVLSESERPVLSAVEGRFTRRQALQNARFLEALARTGNARLAARQLGVHRATYTKRRASHPAFAADWEMALAAAHANLHRAGGPRPPEASPNPRSSRAKSRGVGTNASRAPLDCARDERIPSLRTSGGEPTIVRLRTGRLQLRLAPPGRMTAAAEQAFLRALSASANIRLSAAAAGFAHSSFYARKRRRRPFAREMRLALKLGWERLELALLEAGLADSHADDQWRHNDPPPIPPMSASEALQLLHLHNKTVNLAWDQPHRRKRRGESQEVYVERLRAMWTCEKAREAEDQALRRAAPGGDGSLDDEPPPPDLPPLHLVTGWSKAKPVEGACPEPVEGAHNPKLALFGGWRIRDWKKRRE